MDWQIAQELRKGARNKIHVTSKAICFSLNLLEINSQGICIAAKKKKSSTFIGLSFSDFARHNSNASLKQTPR